MSNELDVKEFNEMLFRFIFLSILKNSDIFYLNFNTPVSHESYFSHNEIVEPTFDAPYNPTPVIYNFSMENLKEELLKLEIQFNIKFKFVNKKISNYFMHPNNIFISNRNSSLLYTFVDNHDSENKLTEYYEIFRFTSVEVFNKSHIKASVKEKLNNPFVFSENEYTVKKNNNFYYLTIKQILNKTKYSNFFIKRGVLLSV